MIDVTYLDAHDPLPEGHGKTLTVLHRFEEENPDRLRVELLLSGRPGRGETITPLHTDKTPYTLDEAIAAALDVAREEGLDRIYVLDRTAGPREQDIIAHHGDHSVAMDKLSDFDIEDGERGTDMRDRRAGQ
jgi:hypothetical protein